MADFSPRYLRKAEVTAVCNAYLRSLEENQLREHLRLFAGRFADGNPMELQDSLRLQEILEAERERLVAAAEGNG